MAAITCMEDTYDIIIFLKIKALVYNSHCACVFNVNETHICSRYRSSQLNFYYYALSHTVKNPCCLKINTLYIMYISLSLILLNICLTQHYSALTTNMHDIRSKNKVVCWRHILLKILLVSTLF